MLQKINPQKDNFQKIWKKIDENFEYLEQLLKVSSVRLNYERFKASDGHTITLSRPYQMNNNSIELYIDGVRQHPDTFVEINPRTIQIMNIRDIDQVIDVYYRESFVLDATRRDSDLAPIYTLTNTVTVEYTTGRVQLSEVDRSLYIPSDGQLWRIIIAPKEKPLVGSFSIKLYNSVDTRLETYKKTLYPSIDNIDEYYSIIEDSNVIIIDVHRNPEWNLAYVTGDLLDIHFETENANTPAKNEYEITYVIKQTTREVNL